MARSAGIINGDLNATLSTMGAHRLGLSLAGGTLTVLGSNGKALGDGNPGYVAFQNPTNPGLLISAAVIANQTVTDGAGQLDTWRAGIPPTNVSGPSADWDQDMPLFIYGVLGTALDVAIMLSRNPCASLSPAATSISKAGTILNVDQNDFYSLPGGVIANYALRPCVCLGSLRVRNIVVGGVIRYTFQALSNLDGFGKYHDATIFSMPAGTNGSALLTFFQDNVAAGVVPQFATQNVTYKINRSGSVSYYLLCNGCNVVGTKGTALQSTLPYSSIIGNNSIFGSRSVAAAAFKPTISTTNATGFIGATFDYHAGASLLISSIGAMDGLAFMFDYPAFAG